MNRWETKDITNFLVHCPKGIMFLKSADASGIVKNTAALFHIYDEIVTFVGPSDVVQFITDNEASYKAAGRKRTEKFYTFYWTPCAAHCIDLILEDMAKPNLFPLNAETIEKVRKITRFIYNHAWVLIVLRRDFTHGRDLIQSGITSFATNFIQLQSLFMFKWEPRKMYISMGEFNLFTFSNWLRDP